MSAADFRIQPFDARTREAYIDLCKFCFNMPEVARTRYFTEEKEFAHSLGAWDGDRLACGMWYWAYDMRVRGTYIPMAGVAAVATWPEYRNRGLVVRLLKILQEMMKAEGRPVSVLAPFRWEFYRRLGWAPTFDVLRLRFPPSTLKAFPDEGVTVRAIDGPAHWQTFEALNTGALSGYNGPVCRNEQYWRLRYFTHPTLPTFTYLVERDGEPRGFLIGSVSNAGALADPEEFRVRQAVWLDPPAGRAVCRFLRSLRDQVKTIHLDLPPDSKWVHLFEYPKIESIVQAKMMTKLVDVPGALERLPFDTSIGGSLVLRGEGEQTAPWNAGTWRLEWSRGTVRVEPVETDAVDGKLSIQALSEIYTGYRSAGDLCLTGEIICRDSVRDLLSVAFPRRPTYIEEWF